MCVYVSLFEREFMGLSVSFDLGFKPIALSTSRSNSFSKINNICMYILMCIYMYVYTYVCICVYVYMYTRL